MLTWRLSVADLEIADLEIISGLSVADLEADLEIISGLSVAWRLSAVAVFRADLLLSCGKDLLI